MVNIPDWPAKMRSAMVLVNANPVEIGHDDTTMIKVFGSLEACGLFEEQVFDAVLEMQNRGIIFRDRNKTTEPEPSWMEQLKQQFQDVNKPPTVYPADYETARTKVYNTLREYGLDDSAAVEAIRTIHERGVHFRK